MVEQRPSRPGMSGWGNVILIASLGLNLFFAGWLVGARVAPWRPRPPSEPMPGLSERLRHVLSEDGFRIVTGVIRDVEAANARHFRETEPLRENVKNRLAAEPFDRDAFAKALADLNAGMVRNRSETDKRIADAVAQLSVEDRRRLAELTLPPPPKSPPFGPGFLPLDRPPPPPR